MAFALEHHNLQRLRERCRDRDSCDSAANHHNVDHFRVHLDTVFTLFVIPGFLHTGQIFHTREFWAQQLGTPYETLADDGLKCCFRLTLAKWRTISRRGPLLPRRSRRWPMRPFS